MCSYDDRVETVTDEPAETPASEERVPVLV
jgi:hypothetical protein